jgi:CBS domain-containing protein
MSVRHLGSVLVMDGARLAGIFTERDVVRALASDFDAGEHPIGTWMSTDPQTATSSTTTREALDRMLANGFRHLPVVDEDEVVGVVSIRDLAPR